MVFIVILLSNKAILELRKVKLGRQVKNIINEIRLHKSLKQ